MGLISMLNGPYIDHANPLKHAKRDYRNSSIMLKRFLVMLNWHIFML